MKIAGSVAESYYMSCSRHWPGPWHCVDLTWLAVYCVLHQSTDNFLIHTPRLPIYKQRPFRKPICNRISDDGTMRIKMISREDTAWVEENLFSSFSNVTARRLINTCAEDKRQHEKIPKRRETPIPKSFLSRGNRPIRLTQCCTQFKSPGDKILCVLYLHNNVDFTFKWYGNSWNKTFYSQRISIGYNIELAE